MTPGAHSLTWHPGSIRPYASLWHTVQRVAALNRLNIRELPDHRWRGPGEAPSKASSTELLFNEWHGLAWPRPRRFSIATEVLASWLGEPAEVFAWSHLGSLPLWSRQLVYGGFRLCRSCLAAGYHSALLSIRLLQACPIHGTALLANCPCGRPFPSRLSSASLSHAGHCACGELAFFTRETCRQPLLSAAETAAFAPLVQWLEALTQVVRPCWTDQQAQRADWRAWLSTLVQWGDELGIERPACVIAASPQRARYPVHHRCGLLGDAPLSQPERLSIPGHLPARYWCDEPASWVYRAMQRYLRRHVVRNSEHWVQKFIASSDPMEIAHLMQVNREALLAFGEMLWARTLEPGVDRRRWPFRVDATQDGRPLWGHLLLRGEPASPLHMQLSPGERQWLRYQASGAAIAAAWRRSMSIALQCARSGIADWSVDEHPDPPPELWSARRGSAGLHFVNFMHDRFVDEALPRTDKATRRARQQARADDRLLAIRSTCAGPCLSWTARDAWHVTASWVPAKDECDLHRLLGLPGEKPLFWLFEADDGFVARLRAMKLQVWAPSPQAVIEALRACLRRHRATYGVTVTVADGDPREPGSWPEPVVQGDTAYYQELVRETRNRSRFWTAAAALALAARSILPPARAED